MHPDVIPNPAFYADPTTLHILTTTRDFLTVSADRWTQGGYARRPDGKVTSPQDPAATSFCLLGAMYHAAGALGEAAHRADSFLELYLRQDVTDFNDSHDYATVIAALDDAVTRCRELVAKRPTVAANA